MLILPWSLTLWEGEILIDRAFVNDKAGAVDGEAFIVALPREVIHLVDFQDIIFIDLDTFC